MIIATPSGASRGDMGPFPPVGGSLPTPPSLRRKKIPKSATFGEFVDFWPSESHFALSMPRHKKKKKKKKKLVPPLATPFGGLIES